MWATIHNLHRLILLHHAATTRLDINTTSRDVIDAVARPHLTAAVTDVTPAAMLGRFDIPHGAGTVAATANIAASAAATAATVAEAAAAATAPAAATAVAAATAAVVAATTAAVVAAAAACCCCCYY